MRTFLTLILTLTLISISLLRTASAAEPKMLEANFFTHKQVCEDSKKNHPEMSAALVLLKTHNCDITSNHCINSLKTFSDDANVFIADNFALYQTRFTSFSLLPTKDGKIRLAEKKLVGLNDILNEWGLISESGAQIALIDIKACKELGRADLITNEGIFAPDFTTRYWTMRKLILQIPGAADLIGTQLLNPKALSQELTRIQYLRASGVPEKTTAGTFDELNRNKFQADVFLTDITVKNTGELRKVLKDRTGEPVIDIYVNPGIHH